MAWSLHTRSSGRVLSTAYAAMLCRSLLPPVMTFTLTRWSLRNASRVACWRVLNTQSLTTFCKVHWDACILMDKSRRPWMSLSQRWRSVFLAVAWVFSGAFARLALCAARIFKAVSRVLCCAHCALVVTACQARPVLPRVQSNTFWVSRSATVPHLLPLRSKLTTTIRKKVTKRRKNSLVCVSLSLAHVSLVQCSSLLRRAPEPCSKVLHQWMSFPCSSLRAIRWVGATFWSH
mmetsp:Transcript_22463/g.44132  ORF Transcript_22463/g.44132 Transcript_22463/m.44132 type:complete len:233 (-) Transcript_22463:823-1521(-)